MERAFIRSSCLIAMIPSSQLCFTCSGAQGGGQEIEELPGGSPSIHISVGAGGKATEGGRGGERRRGVRVAPALGSCSSSPFHCSGCFVPALPFDESD